MNSVSICIPTYRRPDLLRKLILGIADCRLNSSVISDINIIIVDNDEDMTAKPVANELKEKFNDTIKIDYHNYPHKGLVNVRNELLRQALSKMPGFIVFIDDDEYPSPDWLNELLETIIVNNGDIAIGKVIPVFDFSVSKYISFWFRRREYKCNKKIKFVKTNNLIIKTETLLKHRIWFDDRFNKTGGEDSYFGLQMVKNGAKINWASKAVVFENVPQTRANIKWLLKRYYNGANRYTFILRIEKQHIKILRKLIISFLYILFGICASLLTPYPFKIRFWGPLKIAEGIGGLTGFLNLKYEEYK